MARNLYDMGDRRPALGDGWLNERQDGGTSVLPTRMILIALLVGGMGFLVFRTAIPDGISLTAASAPSDISIISDNFAACDTIDGNACVLSPGSYAWRGHRYELADISTPSIDAPRCPAEAAQAKNGRMALLSMLNGGAFEARPDAADANPTARILSRDGVSIGELMIVKGYARPWSATEIDWCAKAGPSPAARPSTL